MKLFDQKILFFLGRPFSPIYGLIMRLREKLYAHNLFTSHKFPVPVISVGNLVLGGTGKTPMVQYISTLLQENDYHPAIISRGYRGSAKKDVNIVTDGRTVTLSAEEAGDEPFMMATNLSQIPVLTGKKRIFPAEKAITMGADCLVLDDGFQHLAVKRDINIVLFDAHYQAGNSRIFPGGPLREPIAALKRADCFVITSVTEENEARAQKFTVLLEKKFENKPVFFARHAPLRFSEVKNSNYDVAKFAPSFAFCGIANPERFRQSLDEAKVELQGFLSLPDHATYTQTLVNELVERAQKCGANSLITTEKDAVKLKKVTVSMPLYIAKTEIVIAKEFPVFLEERLRSLHD